MPKLRGRELLALITLLFGFCQKLLVGFDQKSTIDPLVYLRVLVNEDWKMKQLATYIDTELLFDRQNLKTSRYLAMRCTGEPLIIESLEWLRNAGHEIAVKEGPGLVDLFKAHPQCAFILVNSKGTWRRTYGKWRRLNKETRLSPNAYILVENPGYVPTA